jgi:branched-chain amino acid transport system substrate-binding protein
MAVDHDPGQAGALSVLISVSARLAGREIQHRFNEAGEKNRRTREGRMSKLLCQLVSIAAIGIGTAGQAAAAEAPKSIRIGYAISLSGVNAQGAATTTLPGYELWVKDVNDQGGIFVKEFGKKIPLEVVAKYDDTSSAETLLRLEEKLMSQDKVDFVLPPWSTGFNLAVAPIFAKYGYPHLAVTANANDEEQLVKQFPTLFFFLNQPIHFAVGLIEVMNKFKADGKINNKVAMLTVGDQFGAEMGAGYAAGLKQAGYEVVLQKSYPLGAADLTNEIKEAKASGADSFIAGSYPPDTFMLTGAAITQGYNPRIWYTAVGTAFAEYGGNFKDKAEGVLGIGGWDPNLPGAQDYYKRQLAVTGHAPDGWASPVTYASLQILQQAIEKAGTLDRKAVTAMIAEGGPWNTVSGPIDLKTHIREHQWAAGQWQKGQFVGVAPTDMPGAQPVTFPKPAW